jgi:26S proteasome non-ATPase regulatory subunit 10
MVKLLLTPPPSKNGAPREKTRVKYVVWSLNSCDEKLIDNSFNSPADRIGNTPLHLALGESKKAGYGVIVTYTDLTSSHSDSGHGSTAVILLEEGGADRDRVNQDGQRPMEMQGTNEIEQKKVLDYVRSRVG